MIRLLLAASLALLVACRPTHDAPAPGSGTPAHGSAEAAPEVPGDPLDTVVATQGPISITARDVLATWDWRRYLASLRPGAEPEPVQPPADDLERLVALTLDQALIWVDAERLNLAVDEAGRAAELAATPRVAQDLERDDDPWADFPRLDRDAVLRRIDERVLYARWVELLRDRLTDERLWEVYQDLEERVTLDVVAIPNIPSDAEIDALVDSAPDRIEEAFRRDASSYWLPRRAHVQVIRLILPEDADVDQRAALRDRLEVIRERAAIEPFADLARELSEDSSAERGGDYGWVVHRQMPDVFDLAPGDISPVLEDRFSLYIARLVEIADSAPRELDDTLRREIAAALVRGDGPTAEARATADRFLPMLRGGHDDGLHQLCDASLSRFFRTEPFRDSGLGVVPGLGQSDALVQAAFDPSLAPGDIVPGGPFLLESDLVLARLVDHTTPERTAFEADIDTFRERYADTLEQNAWAARLREFADENPRHLDLEALRQALAL